MALKQYWLLTICLEQLIVVKYVFADIKGFGLVLAWPGDIMKHLRSLSDLCEMKRKLEWWDGRQMKRNAIVSGRKIEACCCRVLGVRPSRGLLSRSARRVISIMSLNVSLHPVMQSCSEGIGLPIGEAWQSCFSKMSWYYYLIQIFSYF